MTAIQKQRPPVMADVAKEAGVSHQTVSRVLNEHPHVRGETRTRVRAAIDKLGYRRNLVARALVTRHSRTLGVVSFDTTLDQMALGVLRAFAEQGVKVPEQVSVVGFDDIPESEFFSPPLATVRQDFGAVGRHSIGVPLRQIETDGPREPERLVVSPQFVPRVSSSPESVRPPSQYGPALAGHGAAVPPARL